MGHSSLRSLLVAAVVISNCITWTASRHHYTHNVHGHRSRHRRQGAGLFLSSSYVIPGGEGSGPWADWGEVSPCSRTCGGGVASQKRICLVVEPDGQARCTGGDTKYFSCETQDCPDGSKDFRAEQCSEYDNVPLKGIRYKWVPYTKGSKPCELNCMPRGERFYYKQQTKVVDGTRCNEESFDVCVNGECQPVGCDFMLGSSAREDKCRQCRGNGTNCHTVSDLINTQDLRNGYNDILLIPQGATNILIEEVKPSSNYLAIRAKNNTYYLNGGYIIDFPRSIEFAGAIWQYERSQNGYPSAEKLRCLGPTEEPLFLSLLLQEPNVGIQYEYSVPNALAPPPNQEYHWVHDEFTPCSASCGGGFQTRNVTCRSREDLEIVDESLCDVAFRQPANQSCNTQPCAAKWVEGSWGPCSKPCGQGGSRSREVHCEKIITNGYPSVVADKECFELLGPKPALFEKCNENATCPIWFTGPWKPCDKLCDEGKQTRQVVCYQKSNGKIEVLDDELCEEEKPAAEQACILHPCDGVDWMLTDWVGCDSCLSTVRTRTAVCATKGFVVVNDSLCAYHKPQVLEEPCDKTKLPACEVQWYATQWSKCSAECGKGVQTRRVFCGLFDGASVMKVDDERCDQETKYNDTKSCEIVKCPSKWYAGPWSECTEKCGGGEQHRRVTCLSGERDAISKCDVDTIPDDRQSCNLGPCDEDDLLPLHPSATTIMDEDEEECEEEEDEEYPEVGADEDLSLTTLDEMFSDSPSTGFSEIESEFTAGTGSGETYITEEGSGETTESSISTEYITDTSETGSGEDTSSTETEETSETSSTGIDLSSSSLATEPTVERDTASTDLASPKSESTDETSTESTGSTESSSTIVDYDYTDESTVSGSTETGGSTESPEPTESGATDASTVSGETESSDSTDATESSATSATDTSESDSTGETLSTVTDETSESSPTDETSETSSEESTLSTSTDETSESESTDTSDDSTESSGSTEATSTESPGSTEAGSTESTEVSGSTEGGSTESGATESGSSTELSGSTESSGATESSVSSETGSTEVSGSTETTESGPTEVSGSTETTESSGSTESESTGSTSESETGSTESTTEGGSTESVTEETGSTVSGTEETGSTETGSTEGLSSVSESSEESTVSSGTTPYDWASTIEEIAKKPKCKPRVSKCAKTKFGCCPDKRTYAAGPFDEGCANPRTCAETEFGCCPDGVSPALGPKDRGCPVEPCQETLFGCCKSDNKTSAEGNDQEGCPPPPPACKSSKFGCCKDEKTQATGPKKKGCPETTVPKKATKPGEATTTVLPEGADCNATEFGCCPDGVSAAAGAQMEGCVMSCNSSAYGCCPDGETPAHGYDYEGCCLLYPFGCCPDNFKPAEGPHLEGCGCQSSRFGCCPDKLTLATGPDNEGCGCQYTEHGCCPDRHTPASGPDNAGCDCHTFQFGCCEDGVTTAKGPGMQGCLCQQTEFGCCGDDKTPATGPDQAGCDCSTSKYGCCPDGETAAQGTKFLGCTDKPVIRQAACALSTDRGPCSNYTVYWYYDLQYGGCSRFWYGGCEGNGNRFTSKDECEDVCVYPSPKDACNLPMVKGACMGYHPRWHYDATRELCTQFVFGGCLGNANNFDSRELCQKQCEPAKSEDQCSLPIERGSCAGNYLRWGWVAAAERCEQFVWGGCEGNPNRFGSEAACLHRCNPPGVPKLKETCALPAETGECADYTEKWYYDTTIKRCRQFYYGGCGGNQNRFSTQLECESQCFEQKTTTAPPTQHTTPGDLCAQPSMTGDCDNYQEKWFFDANSQRCQQFYYGGCGGNDNRFDSAAACAARCGPRVAPPQHATNQEVCFMGIDPGACSGAQARWAYAAARGACVEFSYSGCGGNQNNFPDRAYCDQYCASVQDVCQLPMMSGPCDESLMRWFYDPASDSCSQFTYSGCEGNDNRFESLEDCERRCRTGPAPRLTTTPLRNITTTPAPQSAELPPACRILPEATEECSEEGEVWYRDVAQHACVSHRNAAAGNSCRRTGVLPSEEACERTCGAFRNIEVCRYPVDPGPCRSSIPKFYYDEALGSCVEFAYGGCHGGPNRFSSVDECEDVCKFEKDPCKRTPKALNCFDYVEAWFFDEGRDECYGYGTCNPNDPSRFATRAECEGQCRRAPAAAAPAPQPTREDECATPRSFEGCNNSTTRFYYDTELRKCVESSHGDCGNLNSYVSEEECERHCGAFRGVEEGNEVLPDCDRFNDECSRLRCDYGVQRTRAADGCERCSCVQVEVDCAPLQHECQELKCAYGVLKTVGSDGCERCTCTEHPCATKECPSGQRCVATPYRDPITQEVGYTADCHVVNKPGSCPLEANPAEDGHCRRECNDDADCRGVGKCCARGCSQLCLEPATPTSPAPVTTTYAPELPQAPQANPVTEPEVKAQEGGKATLRCLFHGNPLPKITWRRGEITIDGDLGRYRLLSDGALEIVSLYRNDSGVYICVAENIHGISQQEVRLQVNVAVNTRLPFSETRLAVGAELSLPCDVDGYPLPDVHWTKDNARLQPDARTTITDSRLTISGLALEDSGAYGCHARNDYSEHSSFVQVAVQGVFVPVHCTDNPFFANCKLIVRSKFCNHQYYSRFCCESCVKAGQLNALELGAQADEAWKRKK